MIRNYLYKKLRRLRRRLHTSSRAVAACFVLLAIGLIGYAIDMQNQRPAIDPTRYTPLLNLIGKVESDDNYNAYFGNASNKEIDFTNMPIAEVLSWQANFVAQGNPSSAVGRYQIINTTLTGLVDQLAIDTNQKFDESTQDRLAIALLERRGSLNYVERELTPQEFAANLSREWAGLPRVIGGNPDDSYYAGDGLNKSRTSVNEVLKVIEPISAE